MVAAIVPVAFTKDGGSMILSPLSLLLALVRSLLIALAGLCLDAARVVVA